MSQEKLQEHYHKIIEIIGEDPKREGLQKTPERVAKAMQFLTSGYEKNIEDLVGDAIFDSSANDIVLIKNIEFYSLCEHHLLPFHGVAHIAYIPDGKIIGLSKIARIVDMYTRRLQVQEHLTNQVADAIYQILKPRWVGVGFEAKHFCMMMRGVEKESSKTFSCTFRGEKDECSNRDFINLIK